MNILEINQTLNEAANQLEEMKQLRHKLYDKRTELDDVNSKRIEALEILNKENHDVEVLKKVSFHSFLATVMNNKSEKLDKEEMEALRAKQHYDACVVEETQLREEVERIQSKIANEKTYEKQYADAFEAKKTYLKSMDQEFHVKIEQLDIRLRDTYQVIVEIKEARAVASDVIIASGEAIEALESAKSFGAWDIVGGGMLATMAKRDKMSAAENKLNAVNYGIKKLQKELKDVKIVFDVDLNIGSYLKGMDFFFDNIFTDIAVQSKIDETLTNIRKVKGDVNDLHRELDGMLRGRKKLYTQLDEEINQLILQA